MPDEDADEKRLHALMDEQQKLHIVHEQRLTQVETRITTMEVKLPFLESAIGKLTDIVDRQERQTTLNEAAIVAIRDRTDQFAEHMEKSADRLVERQEKSDTRISKLESKVGRQDTKWKVLQAVVLAALGIILTMVFQHISAVLH